MIWARQVALSRREGTCCKSEGDSELPHPDAVGETLDLSLPLPG